MQVSEAWGIGHLERMQVGIPGGNSGVEQRRARGKALAVCSRERKMRRAGHQQWEEGAGRGTGCGRAGYACRRERAQLLEGSSCLAVLQDVFGRMGESLIACLPSDILGSFHSFSHVFADIFSARSHCTSTNTKKLDQLRNGAGDGSTSSVLNTLQIFILREIKTLQRSLKGMYTAHWSVSWLLQY